MILVAMLLLIKVRRYLSKVTFFIKDLTHLRLSLIKKKHGLLERGMQHGCVLNALAIIMIAPSILPQNITLGIFQSHVNEQKLNFCAASNDKWIDLSMAMEALHVNQSRSLHG